MTIESSPYSPYSKQQKVDHDAAIMARFRMAAHASEWIPSDYTEEDWIKDVEFYLKKECTLEAIYGDLLNTPNTKLVAENAKLRSALNNPVVPRIPRASFTDFVSTNERMQVGETALKKAIGYCGLGLVAVLIVWVIFG